MKSAYVTSALSAWFSSSALKPIFPKSKKKKKYTVLVGKALLAITGNFLSRISSTLERVCEEYNNRMP